MGFKLTSLVHSVVAYPLHQGSPTTGPWRTGPWQKKYNVFVTGPVRHRPPPVVLDPGSYGWETFALARKLKAATSGLSRQRIF